MKTSKGQVTIPKEMRKLLGIRKDSKLSFSVVGDHIELRILEESSAPSVSGYGMLKSKRRSVPADFDPASILDKENPTK